MDPNHAVSDPYCYIITDEKEDITLGHEGYNVVFLSSVELFVSIQGMGILYISAVLNENNAKTKECGMGD